MNFKEFGVRSQAQYIYYDSKLLKCGFFNTSYLTGLFLPSKWNLYPKNNLGLKMMVKIFTVLPEQNKSIKVLFAEPHRTEPNT